MKLVDYVKRRTRIVCTLGPASDSEEMITRLAEAGMDVARLNLAHSDLASHAETVRRIREVSRKLGRSIAILVDLPGPRYRCGNLKQDKILLEKGHEFTVTTRKVLGDERQVSIVPPSVLKARVGSPVFLANGALELQVEEASPTDLKCLILVGGYLTRRMSISIPGARPLGCGLTNNDRKGLKFAADHQVDFIGLSFVCSADDVAQAKRVLRRYKKDIPVVAKIETQDALDNLDKILDVADGVMVARGDLGVEINVEKVPIAQKKIIRDCNLRGKPVITATQMMESMVNSMMPTRAEAADVANAVLDGTDAVMLSEETAIGKYPIETVAMMSRIARETEAILPYEDMLVERGRILIADADDAIAHGACHIAGQLGAVAVVVFTSLGSTAMRVSRYRPKVPIIAFTPYGETRRKLSLCWGVSAQEMEKPPSVEDFFIYSREFVLKQGIGKKGELIVITAGVPLLSPGKTNIIKVEKL